MATLHGSICLSEVPKELFKKVTCKDGTVKTFLNIRITERKEPITFGDRTFTHFICSTVRKDEQEAGKKYIWGDLRPYGQKPSFEPPTVQEMEEAPTADEDSLPF